MEVMDCENDETGVHFLSEQISNECDKKEFGDAANSSPTVRTDLLEYMIRSDGKVVCKLCGEVLQSRTHWYRHKYKIHSVNALNPTPLFQCEQCGVYFKSRKGYIGHLSSRHNEVLADSTPVTTNTKAESISSRTTVAEPPPDIKDETDPEMSIPKTSVPNYQTATVVQSTKSTENKNTEPKKTFRQQSKGDNTVRTASEWEEKRIREEKLVADIIARVRKECEGRANMPARRAYSRRTSVMHS
ncbi:unnamed protein product [Colias eurytheme]|nr:unnamed protein product [Colias eurytheme]